MKNALILHGTSNNSQGNWFQWLKSELEKNGWKVWVPDLPDADHPSVKNYNKHIFGNKDWKFNGDSYIIGHSSGASAILGILQALPQGKQINTATLIGTVKPDPNDDEYSMISDFKKIKESAKKFIYLHSDNDPYCSLENP